MLKLRFFIATLMVLVFAPATSINAQDRISITGYILDKNNNNPLPYVNIGFVNEAVGTVSDDFGKFVLTFNPNRISFNSVLQISSIGYETLKIEAKAFYSQIAKNNKIYLKPAPYILDEVLLDETPRREKLVGSFKKDDRSQGYWLNNEALGGEIATRINIDRKNSLLQELQLYVIKNNSGDIKIRINIYELNNGAPGKNILKNQIYHTITKRSGEEAINLKPYNIMVSDDIIVSIELIKVFGNFIDFEVAASRYKGTSFTRHLSQDAWKKYDKLMAFRLKTSYPIAKKEKDNVAREVPEKVTLYWDTSLAMEDRNVGMELDLLKQYLSKLKSVQVEAIRFNTTAEAPVIFNITKGNAAGLINYLKTSFYNGATSFKNVLKENPFQADAALVFTNGNNDLEPLKQLVYIPAFYINSQTGANHYILQTEANYGEGHYINLLKTTSREALQLMLKDIDDKKVYTLNNKLGKNQLKGVITNDTLNIQGAIIKIKNSLVETTSDKEGRYTINAIEGDILEIDALGMHKKEVQVTRQRTLNIDLEADGELLDEVIVTGRTTPKRTIRTAYGEKSEDAVGYSVAEITEKDISPGHHTYDQIVSKLPGVVIMGFGSNKRYFFARNMSKKGEVPIIVIDGVVYKQTEDGGGLDKLPAIDFQTIKSVRALRSIVSTNRYGGDGAYGAIVFETEASIPNKVIPEKKAPSLLATGNEYTEQLHTIEQNITKPNYIAQLENAASFEEAKQIYKLQRSEYLKTNIAYYIDVAQYFNKKWNTDFAFNTLSNILVIAKNNPKALRAMAYQLEQLKRYPEAINNYKNILKLRPDQAQSYRDLALIYAKNGYHKEAYELYKEILGGLIEQVDFSGLSQVINNEFQNFVTNNRSKINPNQVPEDYIQERLKYDIRIVFDWNDPNAEFEVQFVNPKKKFFKWSQTKFDNLQRMKDGITKGYHTEEFIIDEDEAGEWLINIESLNEENKQNPTYLKYTLFKNYGLPNETQQVKVVKLSDFKPKVTFEKLLNQ